MDRLRYPAADSHSARYMGAVVLAKIEYIAGDEDRGEPAQHAEFNQSQMWGGQNGTYASPIVAEKLGK